MKLAPEPFGKITRGEKVIESRLYDEKRRKISLGDTIEFIENEKSENAVEVRVVEILKYPSFEELFSSQAPSLFGGESSESLLEEIRRFYSIEDEKKYGVIGIRIEPIK